MPRIRIRWGADEVTADLRDTRSSRALVAALPCGSSASTWGEEVYFALPVEVRLEADAAQVVEPGAICFWVDGHSLALPYGPTPVSKAGECRLVTRCNVLGKIEGDPRRLKSVRDGERISVELVAA